MNRAVNIIFAIIGSFILAGCVNEIDGDGTDLSVITFNACIADGVTKTSYETSGKVNWSKGDVVRYYSDKNASVSEHNIDKDGHSATISAKVPSSAECIIAAYGGEDISNNSVDGFTLSGAVKATQTGEFSKAHISVAKTYDLSEGSSLCFHNITSLVKFSLSRTDVDYVVFKANGGEQIHGNGVLSLTFSGTDPSASFGDDGGSEISVQTNGAGTYYISTLPVTLSKGFAISLYDSNDNWLGTASDERLVIIGNNVVFNLGILDSRAIIPVEKISLSKTSLLLSVGDVSSISATITPENATYKELFWKSSDSTVASVSQTGVINALKSGGCLIEASSNNGIKGSCSLQVYDTSCGEIPVTAPTFSDGHPYLWTKGEDIAVIIGSTKYTLRALSDGNPAAFKGIFSTSTSSYRAFYPLNRFLASTSTTNFNIYWPESQKGVKGKVAPGMFPMVYYGTSAISKGFTITPLGGLLKFSLAGSDVVKVVLEVGSTDSDYLAADVIAVNSTTLNTSIKNAKTIYRTLTMTPLQGSTFESGDYFFSLIGKSSPRSISGYSLTYYKQDGSVVKREFKNSISISTGSVFVVEGTEQDVVYDKTLVSGTVTNASTGAPIKNVLVSDGMQIVKTDASGKYSFTSDLTVSQTVFVIMPAEYDFTPNQWGGWSNFSRLQVNKDKQTIDFKLTPRTDDGSSYRILLLGDPQQMSSRQHSIDSWTYVTEGIKKYRTSVSVPLYQVSLGDMVTNEIEVAGMAEAYLAKQKNCNVLTFSVPGNHDHVQSATTYYASVAEFSRWFGPYNYSFNLGKQHFIFLDSVNWTNKEYKDGINIQGITFLEKDLAYVDVNTPIHIFTHIPLTKNHNGNFPSQTYTSRMMKALAGRHVDFWYGHVHFNSQRQYTQAELNSYANGVKSIGSHIVSRCGGNWGGSSEVCRCGSPRGFIELDIKGTETHWQFHTLDSNYDHTMNTYTPGQFETTLTAYDPTALYCNIYQWDALWGTPEVWVDGKKLKDMTHVIQNTNAEGAYDPLYQHIYPSVKERGVFDDTPANRDNMHLFKYTPGTERKVEIRVKDRWGEEHKIETTWK